MFENWENFYLIVGSGAGALIGLMFVVATLTAGMDTPRVAQGAAIFVTPIVFHFSMVLVVSALAMVPDLPPTLIAVLLAAGAVGGIVYCTVITLRIFGHDLANTPDWSDKFFYALLPALVYVALAGAAVWTWTAPLNADYAVGGAMLALLLVGIRNAWDLATFFVIRRPGDKPGN